MPLGHVKPRLGHDGPESHHYGLNVPTGRQRNPGKVALNVVGGIFFAVGVVGAGLGAGPFPLGAYVVWLLGCVLLAVAFTMSPSKGNQRGKGHSLPVEPRPLDTDSYVRPPDPRHVALTEREREKRRIDRGWADERGKPY
jgi:hypothetical protein